MENVQIAMPTWEEVKALLPKTTSLYYVDYRDSLDEHLDSIQNCLEDGNYDTLYEKIDDWYNDSPGYAFEYLDKELLSDIQREFDLEEDEAEGVLEQYKDSIIDEYYSRDDSDVIGDLLRNTGKQTMFYDTGIEIDSDSWSWKQSEVTKTRNKIKRSLKIVCDSLQNERIDMMIRQASYGGNLVIYFYDDVDDFISTKLNTITFKKPVIAIINTGNGSGDHCELGECGEINLPFVRGNIRLCKTVSYSYTFEVCGMYSDWCEETIVGLKDVVRRKKTTTESHISIQAKKDRELDKVFASGKCTPGDMKYTRHRNVKYINEYPCGSKCSSCGTFWVD